VELRRDEIWEEEGEMSIPSTEELEELLEKMFAEHPEYASLLGDGEDFDPYGIPMVKLASILLVYHMSKDAEYGRSWAKRGESGVFHNVMRKGDRFARVAENFAKIECTAKVAMAAGDCDYDVGFHLRSALIDLLVDTALYCMMWIGYMISKDDRHFMFWIGSVWCAVTGISYDTIEEYIKND
jgi:hypothetical protein